MTEETFGIILILLGVALVVSIWLYYLARGNECD